jgi:hypothetical protein
MCERLQERTASAASLLLCACFVAGGHFRRAVVSNRVEGLASVSVSITQQSNEYGQRDQAMKAEFNELLRPLGQSLGEVLDP